MIGLSLLAALLCIGMTGWTLLTLIGRAGASWGKLERLALAWGLGYGAVSLGLFGALVMGLGLAEVAIRPLPKLGEGERSKGGVTPL